VLVGKPVANAGAAMAPPPIKSAPTIAARVVQLLAFISIPSFGRPD
jgi:hypothetical protein